MIRRYSKSELTNKYNSKRKRDIKSRATSLFKTVPKNNTDIYLITQAGDRCDNLAFEWYGSAEYWWFVARVNHLTTMNIPAGTRLRIPKDLSNCDMEVSSDQVDI